VAVDDIKTALAISRIIWVDDVFADSASELSDMVIAHPEGAEGFVELAGLLDPIRAGRDIGTDVAQIIADLTPERRDQLRAAVLAAETKEPESEFKSDELTQNLVEEACIALGVLEADRLSFEEAAKVTADLAGSDEEVGYVIDLNESSGPDERGLEILAELARRHSKGIAFILTHAATEESEAAEERRLREEIVVSESLGTQVTVVAKERLARGAAAAFEVGFRRAGFRSVLHRVLVAARATILPAFDDAAKTLLQIAPEALERHVYARGREEGVSELHVVERGVSAVISKQLRKFFGSDAVAIEALKALRSLGDPGFAQPTADAKEALASLRRAEIWDDEGTVNSAFSPLANGDVFQLDGGEEETWNQNRRFVLLGQPCDLMIRQDGSRAQNDAMLVTLKQDQGGNPREKVPRLPFLLDGERWKLDFSDIAHVRLDVLDLACFRRDGRVRLDTDHVASPSLLSALTKVYGARTQYLDGLLAAAAPVGVATFDEKLLLTMSTNRFLAHVKLGRRKAARAEDRGSRREALPERVAWNLRRVGRIRVPYSSALLEQFLLLMGRRAFDLDFEDMRDQ
jgi:hypothetical protein